MDLAVWQPQIVYAAEVGAGGSPPLFAPVPNGYALFLAGIDISAASQPNNGACSIEVVDDSAGFAPYTFWQIQQSANFPGPWAWRGIVPFRSDIDTFQISASIAFNVLMWGFYAPSDNNDGNFNA